MCSNSNAPACVTLKNIVDHRWVFYCDSEKLDRTISYTPLITTGSMAASPSMAASTTSTGKTSSGTVDETSSIYPTDHKASETVAPPAIAHGNKSGFTHPAIIGISVGSITGAVAILALILLLMKKRCRDKNENPKLESTVLSSLNTSAQAGSSTHGDQQMSQQPKSPYCITPAKAQRLSSEHSHRVHEMEANHLSSPPINLGRFSPSGPPPNWDAPPPGPKNPTKYIPYRPGIISSHASPSEISSIRHVHPSSNYRAYSTDSRVISSPIVNSQYVVSPLIGSESTTPLMDQWGSGDKASVGERSPIPSGTVTGPVNWPSSFHIKPNNRPAHGVHRSLTDARGGGSKWISPEAALAHGFADVDDDDHEVKVSTGKEER